jgi:hypothetical protein
MKPKFRDFPSLVVHTRASVTSATPSKCLRRRSFVRCLGRPLTHRRVCPAPATCESHSPVRQTQIQNHNKQRHTCHSTMRCLGAASSGEHLPFSPSRECPNVKTTLHVRFFFRHPVWKAPHRIREGAWSGLGRQDAPAFHVPARRGGAARVYTQAKLHFATRNRWYGPLSATLRVAPSKHRYEHKRTFYLIIFFFSLPKRCLFLPTWALR